MNNIEVHCGSAFRDTLKVHFYPIMICQQNCYYCYARKDFSSNWNKMMDLSTTKSVIEAIAESSLPVSLILLGGEPTLHPHFLEIIDLWDEACNKGSSLKHSLCITTNGAREDIFEKIPKLDNLTVTFSFHPTDADFDIFFKNMKIIQEKDINIFVNILILEDERFHDKIIKAKNKAIEMGIRIQPTLLNSYIANPKKLNKTQEDFIKEMSFCGEDTISTLVRNEGNILEQKEIPLNDFYQDKYHYIKGIQCYQGAYEIDVNGSLRNVCTGVSVPLSKNIEFFKNIKAIQPITCPLESCDCSEYLIDFYKFKKVV